MTLIDAQEMSIANHMYALATLLEGKASGQPPIQYQAVIGWDEEVVRDCCRRIDASGNLGVVAIFDPADIFSGPAHVGFTFAAGGLVCLQLGSLWLASDKGRAVLVPTNDAGKGHYRIEGERFVWRTGWPVADLTRGRKRAARRLKEIAAGEGTITDIFTIH